MSNFQLNRNWFAPTEASLKRYSILKLIHDIAKDQSQKAPVDDTDRCPSPVGSNKDSQETEVMLLDEKNTSTKTCLDNASSSNAEQVIRTSLLKATPLRNVQCSRESVVYRKKFDPGACAGLFSDVDHLQLGLHCPESVISPPKVISFLIYFDSKQLFVCPKSPFLFCTILKQGYCWLAGCRLHMLCGIDLIY